MSELLGSGGIGEEDDAPLRESTIAPAQWPIDMIREPQLEIADIFAIQALAMGYLRRRARHTRRDKEQGKYLFAMLDRNFEDTDDQGVYDGSQDTYMVCKVQKKDYDQWRMAVSFLNTLNTEATSNTNNRELYRFDWLDNGNRQAWYSSTTKRRSDEGLYVQVNDMHPITSDEAVELQDRMLEFSQTVNPISSDSILIPAQSRQLP